MFVYNSLKYVCFLGAYLSFWINHGIFISLKPNYFPRVYSTTIILWEDLRRIYVPILAKTLHSAFSSRNGLTTPIPFRK